MSFLLKKYIYPNFIYFLRERKLYYNKFYQEKHLKNTFFYDKRFFRLLSFKRVKRLSLFKHKKNLKFSFFSKIEGVFTLYNVKKVFFYRTNLKIINLFTLLKNQLFFLDCPSKPCYTQVSIFNNSIKLKDNKDFVSKIYPIYYKRKLYLNTFKATIWNFIYPVFFYNKNNWFLYLNLKKHVFFKFQKIFIYKLYILKKNFGFGYFKYLKPLKKYINNKIIYNPNGLILFKNRNKKHFFFEKNVKFKNEFSLILNSYKIVKTFYNFQKKIYNNTIHIWDIRKNLQKYLLYFNQLILKKKGNTLYILKNNTYLFKHLFFNNLNLLFNKEIEIYNFKFIKIILKYDFYLLNYIDLYKKHYNNKFISYLINYCSYFNIVTIKNNCYFNVNWTYKYTIINTTFITQEYNIFLYYFFKNSDFLKNILQKKSLNSYFKFTKFNKIFFVKKVNSNSYFWQKSILQVVNKYNIFSQTRNYFNYLKLFSFIKNYVLVKSKKMFKIIKHLTFLNKKIKNQFLFKKWNSGFKGNPWTPYNYRFVCYPLFTLKKELFSNKIKQSKSNKNSLLTL